MKIIIMLFLAVNVFAQEPELVGDPSESSEPTLEAPSEPVAEAIPEPAPVVESASVQSLNFNYAPGNSRLEIGLSSEAQFETTNLENDRQVILELKNTTIARRFARKLDTSSFRSNVSLVSPYQSGENVRVVFQLKEPGSVNFVREGNRLVAVIDNNEGATSKNNSQASAAPVPDSNDASAATAAPENQNNIAASDSVPTAEPDSNNSGTKESIDSFLDARSSKRYLGRPITLQLRDAEVHDVFRVIAEASEFNIVLGEDVKGKLTLNLIDVPWDQALDIVLNSNRLAAERFGSVLRITTIDGLTKEKEAEATAKRAQEAAEPLVVKIFPISYAKPEDMKRILEDFLSKEFAGNSAGGGRRGSIQIEPRTNSLVVRDTPSTMEKVKRILRELDTQTPQVLIEAKFVEVSEAKAREVQGRIFATNREANSEGTGVGFSTTNANWGALFGGSTFTSLPTAFAVSPVPGASFGFSPKLGVIPGIGEISAFLSI
ncbi:MAG TPA: secretin N-terminal domain-containing protein, partial [Oligoflexia bacterium]|nr:secretin N-terminal domain-containing protein [Oligoflexia bacterium]